MKKEIKAIPTPEVQTYFSDLDSLLSETSAMLCAANLMGQNVKFDRTLWQNMEFRTSTILATIKPLDRAMTLKAIEVMQSRYQKLIGWSEHPNEQVTIEYRDNNMRLVETRADKGIEVKDMPARAGVWSIIVPIVRRIMDKWADYATNAPADYLIEVFYRLKTSHFIKGEPSQFIRMCRGERPTNTLQWIATNKTNKTKPNYKALRELLQGLLGVGSLELRDIFPRYFDIEYRDDFNRNSEKVSIHFETIQEIINLKKVKE